MSVLKIHLPPEMEEYKADLEYFVATMVRKLHTNRHKGTSLDLCPSKMLDLSTVEIFEAREALKQSGQFEFSVECADVANFAFLAARGCWNMTREQYDKEKENAE